MKIKILINIVGLVGILSVIAGCGDTEKAPAAKKQKPSTTEQTKEKAVPTVLPKVVKLPEDKKVVLSPRSQKMLKKSNGEVRTMGKCFLLGSEYGRLDLVAYCLSNDPKVVKARDKKGQTALHVASAAGHLEIVKLLSKHYDVNVMTKSGITPLLKACTRGHLEIVKFLLSKGADAKHRCSGGSDPAVKMGYTILHGAAKSPKNQIAMIDVLLKHGAKINLINHTDRTALDLVNGTIWKNKQEVIDYLRKKGVKTAKELRQAK